jgi:hypothetical protein
MSTILKALRRLEQDRERQNEFDPRSSLFERVPSSERKGASGRLAIGIALVAAGALGFYALHRSGWTTPAGRTAEPASSATAAAHATRDGSSQVTPMLRVELPPAAPSPTRAAVLVEIPARDSTTREANRIDERVKEASREPSAPVVASVSEPPVVAAASEAASVSAPPLSEVDVAPTPEPALEPPAPEATPSVPRHTLPDLIVKRTVWHPQPSRRIAVLQLADDPTSLELREGDAIGPMVLVEIEPTGVTFLHEGVEVRRRVGSSW